MAPLTWKLLLSTATLGGGQHCAANDSCEDQTALLQSHLASHKSSLANAESQAQMLNFPKMSTLADPTKRHTALAQFEHTALELAQNSASVTPEVVQVCQMTTELLTDTVLSAIESEHDTDQATIDSAAEAFVPIEADRLIKEAAILAAVAGIGMDWETLTAEQGATMEMRGRWFKTDEGCAAAVRECRDEINRRCEPCGTCIETCEIQSTECHECDNRLELAHAHVIETIEEHSEPVCDAHGGIHPPSEATYEAEVSMADHDANRVAMEAYIALMIPCADGADTHTCGCADVLPCPEITVCNYETAVGSGVTCEYPAPTPPICPELITQEGVCDTLEASCQATSCAASIDVALQLTLYQEAFRTAVLTYYRTKGRVEITEADRKVEWDTLERVICLLNTLTNDEAGSASSSTTEARIAACQADAIPEITVGVVARGTDHLDINYPAVPSLGDLPTMPPTPCERAYDEITCAGLPGDLPIPVCNGDESLIHTFFPERDPESDLHMFFPCECSAVAPLPLVIPDIIAEVYPMPDSDVQPRPYAATDQQRAADASMMVVENGGQFAAVPAPPFEYSDQDTALAD